MGFETLSIEVSIILFPNSPRNVKGVCFFPSKENVIGRLEAREHSSLMFDDAVCDKQRNMK